MAKGKPKSKRAGEPATVDVTKPISEPEAQSVLDGFLDGQHVQHLLRDSAVLLGGLTVLAYLMSHVYGQAYLAGLHVESGFHGFGLGNLSLFGFRGYMELGFTIPLTYGVLRGLDTHYKWSVAKDAVGLVGILFLAALPMIEAASNGIWPDKNQLFGVIAIILGVPLWIRFVRRHMIGARMLLTAVKPDADPTDKNVQVLRGVLAGQGLDKEPRLINYLMQKIRSDKVKTLLAAAALCTFVILPNIARVNLVDALQAREGWKAVDANGPARIPVYWVGDRYVYVTNTGKECLVHVQIAQVEQARSECPGLVAALSKP